MTPGTPGPGAAAPSSPPDRDAPQGASSTVWTVLALLRWTTGYFQRAGIDTARLDAECLLAAALEVDRMRLYLDYDKPVSPAERGVYRGLVKRRVAERVPVAQLVGRKEFWSLPLRVTADVLTPRPDTETLVSAALDALPDRGAEVRVLDVGTGSGAVALAIASERPAARIVATDVSPAALEVAAENAATHGFGARVETRLGSLYEPVAGERFDLIVSNPPYLGESERAQLAPELAHEPALALFAGPDGGELLRALVAGASDFLRPNGGFAVEVAPAQAEAVAQWSRDAGLRDVCILRDLASRPRVVSARNPASAGRLPPENEID